MIRKILRKNIKKWFPIIFDEMLNEQYLCRLYEEMKRRSNIPDDFEVLYNVLKERLQSIDEVSSLYSSLKILATAPSEIEMLKNSLREYDERIVRQALEKSGKIGKNCSFGLSPSFSGVEYMKIGNDFRCGVNLRFQAIAKYAGVETHPQLVVGDNVSFEDFCHVGCVDRVEIGSGTMIASKVFITDHFHGDITAKDLALRPELRPLSHTPVVIGRNVWIGDGVCILPGVKLGDNVIVGANAVVTHSFENNAVIAGCPARLIRYMSR